MTQIKGGRPADIVANEEIEPAVAVVIQECSGAREVQRRVLPEELVSGRSFLPKAPLVCRKRMPAASVTSVKRTAGMGTAGGRPLAVGPLLSTDTGASHTRTASPAAASTAEITRIGSQWWRMQNHSG